MSNPAVKLAAFCHRHSESDREFLARHSTEYACAHHGHHLAGAYVLFVLAEYDASPSMFTYWDHSKAWPVWFERSNQ